MKKPLLAIAAIGAIGLALATPASAEAGQVQVGIYLGVPGIFFPPIPVVYYPRVMYRPVVAYRAHYQPYYYRDHRDDRGSNRHAWQDPRRGYDRR